MIRLFQGILLCIWVLTGVACKTYSERVPQRVFEEGMISANSTYWSANKDCYAYNQDEFGRNPRLVNISWCRKKLRNPPDSYVSADWEFPIPPNATLPLNEYRCFTKTVSNFGSRTRWFLQKRCKKLDTEE